MQNRNKKFQVNSLVFILILSSVILLFSISQLSIWVYDNHKNRTLLTKIDKKFINVNKDASLAIDFKGLEKVNKDLVSYIKVKNTNIDYPIVKTTDNNYYLNHSFDKSRNKAGWIFINYLNHLDGTDKNISIFAHARLDGTMFGSLKNTLNNTWQSNEENRKILYVTKDSVNTYLVFSTYKIKTEDYYLKSNFANDLEYSSFLSTIKSRSNYNYNVEVNNSDKIITLSTCDINDDYRIVLHAKLLKE